MSLVLGLLVGSSGAEDPAPWAKQSVIKFGPNKEHDLRCLNVVEADGSMKRSGCYTVMAGTNLQCTEISDAVVAEILARDATIANCTQTIQELSSPSTTWDSAAYCADSYCGGLLLSQGWSVLAEFGALTPSRFGGTQLSSYTQFAAASWTTCSGFVSSNMDHTIQTSFAPSDWPTPDPGLGWWRTSSTAACVEHTIPQGTTKVLAAWGSGTWKCGLRITDASGQTIFTGGQEAVMASSTQNYMRIAEVAVNLESGSGKISLIEDGGICFMYYVLTSQTPHTAHSSYTFLGSPF
jgi:hypothetical protein